MVVQQISGTAAFFRAMAPVLFANLLTITFVYCFAKISQKERDGVEEGKLPTSGCSSSSSCLCCMGCMSGELGPWANERGPGWSRPRNRHRDEAP